MSSKPYALIVGGASTAGRSALSVVREQKPGLSIVGTTSGTAELEGYDRTMPECDLNRQDIVAHIAGQLDGSCELLVFTPAFGPIGFAVEKCTPAQIQEALNFSVRPMVALAKKLQAGVTVSYSAFYWLEHTLAAYGAMAYAKLQQERLAIADPGRFRVVRAGTFRSKATRGITILLQRQMRSGAGPGPALVEGWKASGKKFGDFFFDFAFASEQRSFGGKFPEPHSETDPAGLSRAFAKILGGDPAPIQNVIGQWHWTDSQLPKLGAEFTQVAVLENESV